MNKLGKLPILGFVFLLITSIVCIYFFIARKNNTQSKLTPLASGAAGASIKKLPESSDNTYSKQTDLAIDDNIYVLSGALLAYSINSGGYPQPTQEGWDDFTSKANKNSTTSPVTQKTYIFTQLEPRLGEIQYRSPGSCDSSYTDFVPSSTAQTYAFRLRLSAGNIRCVATI